MTPDTRRAMRSIVHAIGALVMLAMLGWIIYMADTATVKIIACGLVLILIVREFMHGAENVSARWRFKVGLDGAEAEVGGDTRQKQEDGK